MVFLTVQMGFYLGLLFGGGCVFSDLFFFFIILRVKCGI